MSRKDSTLKSLHSMDSNSRDPKPLSVVFALQLLPPSAPGSDRWVHLSTNGNREENVRIYPKRTSALLIHILFISKRLFIRESVALLWIFLR